MTIMICSIDKHVKNMIITYRKILHAEKILMYYEKRKEEELK